MKSLLGNALALTLIIVAMALIFGCTQSNDVVQPQIETTITLTPQFLPGLDSVYTYELWMVKVQNPGDDFIASGAEFTSLGKFTYDNTTAEFMDAAGDSVISNTIDLPETWLNYDYIVVSVEDANDQSPAPSGTFILSDQVVDPNTRPIALKFPVSLFGAIGFYFVATPTDDTTYWHFPTAQDNESYLAFVRNDENKGLWVCSRFRSEIPLWDTLSVVRIDTIIKTIDTSDTSSSRGNPDTIGIEFPDPDTGWAIDTTAIVISYDTLQHRRINVPWMIEVDSNYKYTVYPIYEIDSITTPDYPFPLGDVPYYVYSGPLGGLPDVSPYGWRYNTWVMLEQPASGDNSGMNLRTMIPFGDGRQQDFTGMNTWGVLPLGGFLRSDSADFSNEFSSDREVPNYPGSDYVKFDNASDSVRYANLNLFHSSMERWGTVIIGMEPIAGNVAVDSTVNFPLFFMSEDLPLSGSSAANGVQLHNWSQFLPVINVAVELHQ